MLKFKINETDMLGARAGTIKDSVFEIHTPIRVLTSNELEHMEKIKPSNLAIPFLPHPIFEIARYFKPQTIYNFIKDADVCCGLQNMITKTSNKAGQRFTKFHPIIDKKITITEEINRKLLELQIQSNLDCIEILDEYNSTPKSFERRVKKSMEVIEDSKDGIVKTPMPSIRMDTDEIKFEQKIKTCIDFGVPAINLIYSSINGNYQNYSFMQKISKDNEVLIHLSEAERTWRGNKKTSMPHLIFKFGIDSVSLKTRPFNFGLIVPTIAKRFDSKTLGHIPLNEHNKLHGEDPKCNCPICNGKTISEWYKVWNSMGLLSSALKVHETNASLKQAYVSRKYILENEYRKYLRNKLYMKEPFQKLFGIDLYQTTLKR